MPRSRFRLAAFSLLTSVALSVSAPAVADDDHERKLEGRVEYVNFAERSLVVRGVEIFTTRNTKCDDDLARFEDIHVGDQVEVEYVVRNGRRIAREIERDN